MYYFVVSLTLSLTNLAQPMACITQLFCWRNANDIILHETTKGSTEKKVETLEKMGDVISEVKTQTTLSIKDKSSKDEQRHTDN